MITRLCLLLLATVLITPVQGQTPDPKPAIEKAVSAVGGKEKLLKIFRMKEVFHFGSTPEPAAGKKRSTRESVLEMPGWWWINKKERAVEPAKDDVWAWTLGILVDEKSKIEVIPDLTDEGKPCFGLKVSGSVTPAMSFYFDQQTSLLKRLDWRGDIYRFSEWKEHDGVKYASKTIILKAKDNKPWFFHEVLEVERLAQLPAGLAKP
ncbi:hypothetical protein [Prosthecobacter sp.]|uniref:hypothetical protein n=1 Tax=Prosthecobacter sp. TaxID=1965333 RepID=UPI002488D326|nr:hypothetical protein [Prosthecobacter sp.]MDI1310678.1 hypothetical protein [Prosthecobacter sp.]